MMPTLVLLAGLNGAGKTTFINRFLRQRAEAFRFVNPDDAAGGLTGAGAARDLMAGPSIKSEGGDAGAPPRPHPASRCGMICQPK